MELVRCLQYLPCYNFAEYARKITELRAKGVDEINFLIGNSNLPTLVHRMSLVVLNAPAAGPVAGAALPHSFLLAFIACLMVGNSIVQFARRLPSAGSFYTFNSYGLGKLEKHDHDRE